MRKLILLVVLALSMIPVSASAQTTDLTNFQSKCIISTTGVSKGSSTVSGSFDLAGGGATRIQEKGYASQVYAGRTYTRITYFGPAWTILANNNGSNHYTFTMPAVSAYSTQHSMPQGAILYVDNAGFLDYRWTPALPITLTFGTGACHV